MGVLSLIERSTVRQRWVAGAVALAVAVAAVVVVVRIADYTAAGCSELRSDTADEAAIKAEACGSDVEVMDERTPWVSVYAQPDGNSRMTMDSVAGRTSVNGEWEDIDLTIATEPASAGTTAEPTEPATAAPLDVAPDDVDETLAPDTSRMLPVEAPVYPMWFNPGGVAGQGLPLGVVQRDDAWVALRFPFALPEPIIDGRFVTYPLTEGVRLSVR
ncbi:hypothetical protein [Microbacterium sp. SD291]|uniref:hypothetical protein n=1 Tax=Microbacterium sp. SD291 TaxID=2782007 RepID=UPI001A96AFA9|nr:hypothetical protein [Microbacterium sp. SD291]MBO0981299.1 hypothetical protein [Microbacterium sp. SD291]